MTETAALSMPARHAIDSERRVVHQQASHAVSAASGTRRDVVSDARWKNFLSTSSISRDLTGVGFLLGRARLQKHDTMSRLFWKPRMSSNLFLNLLH